MFTCSHPDEEATRAPDAVDLSTVDEIIALRLKMRDGKITLLRKDIVDGRWNDSRIVRVGARLYYEILDDKGNVLARGYRNDPTGLNYGRDINFLVTAPYVNGCTTFRLYKVGYESTGKDEYSRDYKLLASFDIDRGSTTAMAE